MKLYKYLILSIVAASSFRLAWMRIRYIHRIIQSFSRLNRVRSWLCWDAMRI